MLSELLISDFALIEKQSVRFSKGLNVISGETGAGKSILLQAIQFLLGAKPKEHYIRAGSESTEVQGVFTPEHEDLPDIAQVAPGEELTITRSLNRSGKSKVFINGRLANISVLEEVAGRLVNICNQNQHMRLLDPRYHLELIDGFAGLSEQMRSFRALFQEWRELTHHYTELKSRSALDDERRCNLAELVRELRSIDHRAGLRAELETSIKRLANAERLRALGQGLLEILEEDAFLDRLSRAAQHAQEMRKLDPTFDQSTELLLSARTELKECTSEVSHYVSQLSVDEETLAQLRERLAELARLERKYKCDESGLVALEATAHHELGSLSGAESISELEKKLVQQERELLTIAERISEARKAAAQELALKVRTELAELSMKGCQLSVAFEEVPIASSGIDRGELLIASNPGEPLKPLRQVASGGELSRILLVLKKVLRDQTGVNVLVFDEVDTGISGSVARAVGGKLKELARFSQVICITHLPQVASLADHHLLVDKQVGKRTASVIREIVEDERVEEIARMLAGYEVTKASRESARELLSSKS